MASCLQAYYFLQGHWVADIALATKAAIDVAGWKVPKSYDVPSNVENLFTGYRDPRVPEPFAELALAFQNEHHVNPGPSTLDLSNKSLNVGVPKGREFMYHTNHSYLGGYDGPSIRAGRD